MVKALEVGDLSGLVAALVALMIVPPIIFSAIGFAINKKYPKGSKILYILAGLYLLVGLGICGTLIAG
ncbi:hypothetical protein SAMN04489761_1944 [Tenacibaculum sp. MAR_2009_124]|uniref:hypothetical protein n=1 Tax=Tenacibaculum sp. MAR_2009_124 TaxID=1250059 RepID=UPI00089896DF|nr:hypothetical protein [Tenacibaculum sp. MAR_2009_124]SEB84813.1 hypothetical protein SAMN04489761_1944 [Tenacibaculum sp. MAR_2009_124]